MRLWMRGKIGNPILWYARKGGGKLKSLSVLYLLRLSCVSSESSASEVRLDLLLLLLLIALWLLYRGILQERVVSRWLRDRWKLCVLSVVRKTLRILVLLLLLLLI